MAKRCLKRLQPDSFDGKVDGVTLVWSKKAIDRLRNMAEILDRDMEVIKGLSEDGTWRSARGLGSSGGTIL